MTDWTQDVPSLLLAILMVALIFLFFNGYSVGRKSL